MGELYPRFAMEDTSMGTQMDFMDTGEEDFSMPVERMYAEAVTAVLNVIRAGHPIVIAFSGGKDSAVTAGVAFEAAKLAVIEGLTPIVVVTSSNTLVESPEVSLHVMSEMVKMRQYGDAHGFNVQAHIVKPSLLSTWQVKILSGRGLPSYAGQNTDCSIDLKITPQRAFRKRLFAQLKGKAEPVTLLGTRFSESEKRGAAMRERGDSATRPVRNSAGDLVMSPIAFWDTDEHVWGWIGYVTSGIIASYSDFEETRRIYADAGGTSCAVVSDAISEGKVKKGGCGARFGCWSCQQAIDKSLETMILFDRRYAYARGLNKLNKFIGAIRYDWTRRHYIGRTIRAGFIAIEPDTFSPATVVAREQIARPRIGDYVRFQTGELERFSHDWDEGLQTSPVWAGSHYLCSHGNASFSGGLNPSIRIESLTLTEESASGDFWFFHHNMAGAGRGIRFSIPCRVYVTTSEYQGFLTRQ
jgi:3'-phosphoadenosine 5'-phosphosulfate sulfotransferase (PAPS reductase)/FAD synthetase